MFLYLALASLTALDHRFMNQFITEHRSIFSLTKKSRNNVSVSSTHITEWQIKYDTIYQSLSLLLRYLWAIIVGHCFLDIYVQIRAVHSSECIYLHCCFTLKLNTDKME